MPTRDPSKTLFDDIIKESKWARREIEKLWSLRSNADGAGVDYNKDNIFDANGIVGSYFHITPTGPGILGITDGILFENDTDDPTDVRIQQNTDGTMIYENTGGTGMRFKNDGGIDPISGFGILLEDNGDGGFRLLSTTGGVIIDSFGDVFQVHNADIGVVIYSTGAFDNGTITDMPGGSNDQPGMMIAASDGILLTQGGPIFPHPASDVTPDTAYANSWFYLSSFVPGVAGMAIFSEAILLITSDPGVQGVMYNDGGVVKISL